MPITDPVPLLKEQLRQAILAEVGKWSQQTGAGVLGLSQPRMSDLEHNRLRRFSLEKLICILARIDHRVDITVVNVRKGQLRIFNVPGRGFR